MTPHIRFLATKRDSALLYGYGASQKTIDLNIVEEVIQDRGIDPGIQYEEKEISRDDKGYIGKGEIIDSPGRVSKYFYLQISNQQNFLYI